MTAAPGDFDAYWTAVEEELAGLPGRAVLERLPRHSTRDFTVYGMRLTSIGPARIFGYLSVPSGDGPFPGLLELPGYGSVNHLPDWHDRQRYVVLTVMHRGQRLADSPWAAGYPGLLTHGIEDPLEYVYRGIAADCLRAAEALSARPEVDRDRVAVAGGDLAVLTAARRPAFGAVRLQGLLLYRAMEARRYTSDYPLEELNDYLRRRPDSSEQAVAGTLAYFDPLHHAPGVRARVAVGVGDPGPPSGAEWLAPLLDAVSGPVERHPLTYRGAVDRNRMDAWLAGHLGVEPRTRFLAEAP